MRVHTDFQTADADGSLLFGKQYSGHMISKIRRQLRYRTMRILRSYHIAARESGKTAYRHSDFDRGDRKRMAKQFIFAVRNDDLRFPALFIEMQTGLDMHILSFLD